MRLLRNELLDKLGFGYWDILTPFNEEDSNEYLFSEIDSF
jgi:hypothetical protein